MKKLEIYEEDSEFIIKRTNEFGHPFISRFISEEGLLGAIQGYKFSDTLHEYKIEISGSLSGLVLNELSKG